MYTGRVGAADLEENLEGSPEAAAPVPAASGPVQRRVRWVEHGREGSLIRTAGTSSVPQFLLRAACAPSGHLCNQIHTLFLGGVGCFGS